MKIFISWSGPRSKKLAEALNEWLPNVIQTTECFYSSEAIRAGQRWSAEINTELSVTDFGILCVTPENMGAPWLNFEAGALSKKLGDDTRVVPVTLGFTPDRVEEPLRQFNGVEASKSGIERLVKSVAEAAQSKIDVDHVFALFWPELEQKIAAIPASDEDVALPQPPDTNEMLVEVRDIVLGLVRSQAQLQEQMMFQYPLKAEPNMSPYARVKNLDARTSALMKQWTALNPREQAAFEAATEAQIDELRAEHRNEES